MKRQQSGFTLVEIAIVLVIIGLLLGGILKGQELINSAKVKNLANDFRVIPTYIYAYQDKYKALPGDDAQAATHLAGPPAATVASPSTSVGNGVIDGAWNSTTATDESVLFWQHVRMANLAAGPTVVDVTPTGTYFPTNAVGGRLGIASVTSSPFITGMTGTYIVCSTGILGKFVKQLDIQMDDGDPSTGSMRAVLGTTSGAGVPTASITDSDAYTVCVTF